MCSISSRRDPLGLHVASALVGSRGAHEGETPVLKYGPWSSPATPVYAELALKRARATGPAAPGEEAIRFARNADPPGFVVQFSTQSGEQNCYAVRARRVIQSKPSTSGV
jgi:hypothetical protein